MPKLRRPFVGREGHFVLEYFLVGRPRKLAKSLGPGTVGIAVGLLSRSNSRLGQCRAKDLKCLRLLSALPKSGASSTNNKRCLRKFA